MAGRDRRVTGSAGGAVKKLGEWYELAVGSDGAVEFEADEVARIERARLVLLGIQPSEVDRMTGEERWDVLEIHAAEARARKAAQDNALALARMRGR